MDWHFPKEWIGSWGYCTINGRIEVATRAKLAITIITFQTHICLRNSSMTSIIAKNWVNIKQKAASNNSRRPMHIPVKAGTIQLLRNSPFGAEAPVLPRWKDRAVCHWVGGRGRFRLGLSKLTREVLLRPCWRDRA